MSVFSFSTHRRIAKMTSIVASLCVASAVIAGVAAALDQDWPWHGKLAMITLMVGAPSLFLSLCFSDY